MRLIDADELKSKIQKSNCNIEHLWKKVVLDVIDNCKTAYDVDEVVDGLKEPQYDIALSTGEHCAMIPLSDAIQIVERGGIYE